MFTCREEKHPFRGALEQREPTLVISRRALDAVPTQHTGDLGSVLEKRASALPSIFIWCPQMESHLREGPIV